MPLTMTRLSLGLACREPPLWCLSVKKRPKDLPLAGARDAGACPSPSPLRGCVQETLAALHPVFGGERANRDPHTAWQAGQRAQKHALRGCRALRPARHSVRALWRYMRYSVPRHRAQRRRPSTRSRRSSTLRASKLVRARPQASPRACSALLLWSSRPESRAVPLECLSTR